MRGLSDFFIEPFDKFLGFLFANEEITNGDRFGKRCFIGINISEFVIDAGSIEKKFR